MRSTNALTLTFVTLGLLASGTPSLATEGARVRVVNDSGAPREIHIARPGMPGTLNLDLINPLTQLYGENSILVDAESLEALGGRQKVVVDYTRELELYLDHGDGELQAELPFWVGDPSGEGTPVTYHCAFQFRSEVGGDEPAASLSADLVSPGSPVCFAAQEVADLLVLVRQDANLKPALGPVAAGLAATAAEAREAKFPDTVVVKRDAPASELEVKSLSKTLLD